MNETKKWRATGMRGVTKKDWQLFREKLPEWQERYMDRLCKDYVRLLTGSKDASDRFWALDKRLRADKKRAGVQMELSKENMTADVVRLIREGAITAEDLADFSEGFREDVAFLQELWKT